MKKIFYFIASAIVALGAVACSNEIEDIKPNTSNDVVSFTVDFDDTTRIAMKEQSGTAEFSFEGNETLYLASGSNVYEFQNSYAAPTTFTGEANGLQEVVKGDVHIFSKNPTLTSDATSKAHTTFHGAAHFAYSGKIGNVKLSLKNSILHCTTGNKAVTLTSNSLSNVAEVNLDANGEYWINLVEGAKKDITVAYSDRFGEVKSTTLNKDNAAIKIFNLGELTARSDWEISDGTRFFETATPDLFVAKNVKLTDNNFCIHKVGDTAWGAGAKYGLVTAGTKNENTAIGLYSANWSGDITISNATTTAHDIYFDKANSCVYVMTVGKDINTVAIPTHDNWYNIAGTMNSWGNDLTDAQKFTYCGDDVWHLIIDFNADDEFKVQLKNDWATCYGHNQIQSGVGRDLSKGLDNAQIKEAGTYEIWVVPSHKDAPLYIIKK